MEQNTPKIALLGGGTGTFTVLKGLREFPVDLTAIVSIADNGGSSGKLRDEHGILPPGDIVKCLIALADAPPVMRQLFSHRIHGDGSLSGHTMGNLFLLGLQQVFENDPIKGVNAAHELLRVKGRVVPVSAFPTHLFAELEDGRVVEGEHAIDVPNGPRAPIRECRLEPSVSANPEALAAIQQADVIVLGPGDLYTSLIPVLLVTDIAEAIRSAPGKLAFVMNLTTKTGETEGYPASRFCETLESILGVGVLDAVIVNSAQPSPDLIHRYAEIAKTPLVVDDLDDERYRVIRRPLLSEEIAEPVASDRTKRSLLRHDPKKLATSILSLHTE